MNVWERGVIRQSHIVLTSEDTLQTEYLCSSHLSPPINMEMQAEHGVTSAELLDMSCSGLAPTYAEFGGHCNHP